MKILLCKGLLLQFLLCNVTYSNNSLPALQGEWMCMDDMDCPDFIFFHKSGRYIVMNDCGSTHPQMPVVERGDWEIRNKKKIIFKNREFVTGHKELGGNYGGFRVYHGADSVLLFTIEKFSNKELIVNFIRDGEIYADSYRKISHFPRLMKSWIGFSSKTKKLILPRMGGRKLLKLSYKALFYVGDWKEPIELTVEDQDGHELWKKKLIFSEEVQKEEILLADKPEVINLTELVFKINAGDLSPSWELQVKAYN